MERNRNSARTQPRKKKDWYVFQKRKQKKQQSTGGVEGTRRIDDGSLPKDENRFVHSGERMNRKRGGGHLFGKSGDGIESTVSWHCVETKELLLSVGY